MLKAVGRSWSKVGRSGISNYNGHYQISMVNLAQNFHLWHEFSSFCSSHFFDCNFLKGFKIISHCWQQNPYIFLWEVITGTKADSCKPDHEEHHNTQNHMFHAPEDLNQRNHQLKTEFLHMWKPQASPCRIHQSL